MVGIFHFQYSVRQTNWAFLFLVFFFWFLIAQINKQNILKRDYLMFSFLTKYNRCYITIKSVKFSWCDPIIIEIHEIYKKNGINNNNNNIQKLNLKLIELDRMTIKMRDRDLKIIKLMMIITWTFFVYCVFFNIIYFVKIHSIFILAFSKQKKCQSLVSNGLW